MTMRPIETRYAGCRFRSRLEARWAVLFDRLSIRWEYEPEGFHLPTGPYLPDFLLPDHGLWVEVKGRIEENELRALRAAADPRTGLPGPRHGPRLLLLGNVPNVERGWTCWQKGLSFRPDHDGQREPEAHPLLHKVGDARPTPAAVYSCSFAFHDTLGIEHIEEYGIEVTDEMMFPRFASVWNFDAFVMHEGCGVGTASRKVAAAYRAARSARFEHGEQG